MTKPAMNTKVKIEIGALATLLFSAIGVWYYFGHPAVGSARACSAKPAIGNAVPSIAA